MGNYEKMPKVNGSATGERQGVIQYIIANC